jgi:hypothetical protein
MFGSYDIPLKIEKESISLSIYKEDNLYIYKRNAFYGKEEKVLHFNKGKVILNPVEPLNKPKEITSFLLIEFERSFVLGPETSKIIFIKFPIEVGVFISDGKNFEILDVMTLVNQKFTLYGDPATGMICKYWSSDVFPSIPDANPMFEGVMEVNITNNTTRWIEVSKAVFNAYDMRIYYDSDLVSMRAKMKVLGEQTAETVFNDSPLNKGMTKSMELYSAGKVSVLGPKFVMEGGL